MKMIDRTQKPSPAPNTHMLRSRRQLSHEAATRSTLDSGRERSEPKTSAAEAEESGGPSGLEPTRYGDWERKGRCIDF